MQLDDYYEITMDEFRKFREEKDESQYLVVDVRFPEEYEEEHIPGCVLLPLAEINARLTELPPDRDIIFYCHSGKRSRTAALFATSVPFFEKKIYNLEGGIISFTDRTVPDYPVLKVFDFDADISDLFKTAMNLEKGAEKFYTAVLDEIGDVPYRKTIEVLGQAETGHARLIYSMWKKNGATLAPFDELYASLPGDIVEGGKSIADHLEKLHKIEDNFEARLLEIILEIEHAAYDLYRTVALHLQGTELERSFITLSEAEKGHMLLASQGMG
ncbi:MAG: hypothetical protein KAR01_08710 [Desulfocapsa sp.]|nr:hypothetical protein [Desulfocapsa sp.]